MSLKDFQLRVFAWFLKPFTGAAAVNRRGRVFAFAEEADELKQAAGMTREEAHAMVDHVYNRPEGQVAQELAGALMTLCMLATAHGELLDECGERELTRVSDAMIIKRIQEKQKEKLMPDAMESTACDPVNCPAPFRIIIQFIGINGAGKTTLAERLARRCAGHRVPHILDSEEHAYQPGLDHYFQAKLEDSGQPHPDLVLECQMRIVHEALGMIERWRTSPARVIIVDRWFESYDVQLTDLQRAGIEQAIQDAGFSVHIIHLVLGNSMVSDAQCRSLIERRLTETRAQRGDAWWSRGVGTMADRVEQELAWQQRDITFAETASFELTRINTVNKQWDQYELIIDVYTALQSRLFPEFADTHL